MKEISALNRALADLNSCKTSVDKIMATVSAASINDIAASHKGISGAATLASGVLGTSCLSIAESVSASVLSEESLIEKVMKAAASSQSLWDKTIAAGSASSIRDIAASSNYEAIAEAGKSKLASALTGASYLKSAAASAASIKGIGASSNYKTFSEAGKSAYALDRMSRLSLSGTASSALHRASVSASSIRDIAASYKKISGAAMLASALPDTSYLSLSESAMASAVMPSVIEKATDVLKSSRRIFLEDSNYLSAMAESVRQLELEGKFSTDSLYENPEILAEASKVLSTATDSHSFIEKFKDSPPLFQTIIYFVILQIFIPQIVSINANLLTPYVKSYLNKKNITKRERINKLPLSLNNINTDQIRFVTGNNVRLRKSPSTNAEILDEMVLGQVITVLSKKKNWINVEYTYEDGKVITGWIFTIYTKRFKK